jgi:hypothetical protein
MHSLGGGGGGGRAVSNSEDWTDTLELYIIIPLRASLYAHPFTFASNENQNTNGRLPKHICLEWTQTPEMNDIGKVLGKYH